MIASDDLKEKNSALAPQLNVNEKLSTASYSEAESQTFSRKLATYLSNFGVETHGITPVPADKRTESRMWQIFFMWFSIDVNPILFSFGAIGPAVFGLGIRSSLLIILVVDIISAIPPAIFVVFGPKLGTRCMVLSRFSWGYYGAKLPSMLNVLTQLGILIISFITGGQILATVSDHISVSVGVVIIALVSFAVTFCGYQLLHWYEAVSWIPCLIAFVIMIGVGGKQLVEAPVTDFVQATPAAIMTFGSIIAASGIALAALGPDYGVYHRADVSSWKIFWYAYTGIVLGNVPVQGLGAVFAAGAYVVPSWQVGLGPDSNIGGLIAAVLAPVGGFGKFLVVLLVLIIPSATNPTMYTVCTSFMAISPVFAKLPRFVIAILAVAVCLPVSIVGASRFYATLSQILSFIGYWIAPWSAIIIAEHFVFRRGRWDTYDQLHTWNNPALLPPGYAAVFTFVAGIGLIVPCMDQTWWTGPIARAGSGDIGILVGWPFSVILYISTRWLERKIWGR